MSSISLLQSWTQLPEVTDNALMRTSLTQVLEAYQADFSYTLRATHVYLRAEVDALLASHPPPSAATFYHISYNPNHPIHNLTFFFISR